MPHDTDTLVTTNIDLLCSSIPRGVGLGVTCALGLAETPKDLQKAANFRERLLRFLLSEIDFNNKTSKLLPTSPTLSGVGILATSGFPLPSNQSPINSILPVIKNLFLKTQELPDNEKNALGPMSAVLSVGTITSFNASRFATTFLPGIAITHSQTDIERILFENSCKLLKLNDFGFGVIVTEGFWKQTKNQSELFEEISTKEWIDLKSKFDILKNERIFRMK